MMKDPQLVARTIVLQDSGWLWALWLQYWANGGNSSAFDFDTYVHGLKGRDEFEEKLLIWAIEDLKRALQWLHSALARIGMSGGGQIPTLVRLLTSACVCCC